MVHLLPQRRKPNAWQDTLGSGSSILIPKNTILYTINVKTKRKKLPSFSWPRIGKSATEPDGGS